MTKRRALGELEGEVMAFLWAVADPVTPADVHQTVAPELAYTTVMTVLTRLWRKGLLERARVGRAFAYTAVQPEANHRAGEMHDTLRDAGNATAVLSSFVESLNPEESAVLRRLLGTPKK